MPKNTGRPPTRTDFETLKAKFLRLQADVRALQELTLHQTNELRTQFTRIAEIQAVLDEERIANGRPRQPRPLLPMVTAPAMTLPTSSRPNGDGKTGAARKSRTATSSSNSTT